MYSLRAFGDMIADAGRFNAYSQAIAKTVHPGDVVVEIGCGPGVFALLACRAGARRVYAIDCAEIAHFGRQLAAANGLEERIEFIQNDSRKTELPERANVIFSDIRGVLPLMGHAIATLEDARRRLLSPGGIMIPQRDFLRAAVIEADEYYSKLITPWKNSVAGMDTSPSLSLLLNEFHSSRFKADQLLTDSQTWGELDYTAGAATRAAGNLELTASRAGTAHGVCVWFETQLVEGIGYSSGPGGEATIYGQAFFPWPEPVPVVQNQKIQVCLHADLVGDDYLWRWETKIDANGSAPKVHFRQSTLEGMNFAPHNLRRRAADYIPELTEDAQAERWILQAMNGKASLQEIAEAACKQFPKLFCKWEDAFHRVAELSGRFSR